MSESVSECVVCDGVTVPSRHGAGCDALCVCGRVCYVNYDGQEKPKSGTRSFSLAHAKGKKIVSVF